MDKYCTQAQKTAEPETNKDKTVISDDYYALCDFLNELIGQLRVSNSR